MTTESGFDGAAAITRSLLGWGVVVGPFYILIGLILAFTRDGFDLGQHQLSLLMLGEMGWAQTANLILSGIMVFAAAVGFRRAMGGWSRARLAAILIGLFGAGMVGSGLFPPDPMAGFPPGAAEEATTSGVLHLIFGGLGFVALGVAAVVIARWFAEWGDTRASSFSRVGGIVVIVGFVGGGALATSAAGVVALWLAVLVGFGWLAFSSVAAYRTVPHPDLEKRQADE